MSIELLSTVGRQIDWCVHCLTSQPCSSRLLKSLTPKNYENTQKDSLVTIIYNYNNGICIQPNILLEQAEILYSENYTCSKKYFQTYKDRSIQPSQIPTECKKNKGNRLINDCGMLNYILDKVGKFRLKFQVLNTQSQVSPLKNKTLIS